MLTVVVVSRDWVQSSATLIGTVLIWMLCLGTVSPLKENLCAQLRYTVPVCILLVQAILISLMVSPMLGPRLNQQKDWNKTWETGCLSAVNPQICSWIVCITSSSSSSSSGMAPTFAEMSGISSFCQRSGNALVSNTISLQMFWTASWTYCGVSLKAKKSQIGQVRIGLWYLLASAVGPSSSEPIPLWIESLWSYLERSTR